MLQLSYRRAWWGSDCWNDCFSDLALFFYDKHGGEVIAGMTATVLIFCTTIYLFVCLSVVSAMKKTISAGFTGIGVILLSLSLKARFIAVSSGKG